MPTEEADATSADKKASEHHHESEDAAGEEDLPEESKRLGVPMLERWAREDAIGGAFTVIKKDGTRIKL